MYISNSRGSEWRKWDLQVGTKHYTNYKGPTLEKDIVEKLVILTGLSTLQINSTHQELNDKEYAKLFVEYFVNFSKIDVIAIANHNTGQGIQEIIDYLFSKKDKSDTENIYNDKYIFPGVEIGSHDQCHIITIFNPECNNDKIYDFDIKGNKSKERISWESYIDKFLNAIEIQQPRIEKMFQKTHARHASI